MCWHCRKTVLQNCPNLQRLRRISNWGKIDPDQIRTIRKEIKARNFDLIIDDGDDSDQEEEWWHYNVTPSSCTVTSQYEADIVAIMCNKIHLFGVLLLVKNSTSMSHCDSKLLYCDVTIWSNVPIMMLHCDTKILLFGVILIDSNICAVTSHLASILKLLYDVVTINTLAMLPQSETKLQFFNGVLLLFCTVASQCDTNGFVQWHHEVTPHTKKWRHIMTSMSVLWCKCK